jgi:hypothetical protein
LRPLWLYPYRSLEPDLAEWAALTYLFDSQATYVTVARAVGCAWVTVWRWVGWDRRAEYDCRAPGAGRAS